MKEDLSSLMDGELDDAASSRCIKALDADADLKAIWNDYHLIGDALRGSAALSLDVSDKVHAALKQEPTILAPRAKASPARKSMMPYAMAASFALAGVVGWFVWQTQPAPTSGLVAQVVPAPKQDEARQTQTHGDNSQFYLTAHQDMATEGFDRVTLEKPKTGVAH